MAADAEVSLFIDWHRFLFILQMDKGGIRGGSYYC